jgi:hypothetical protein
MAFDWTSKTLRKIEMPSLPSLPSLPTVRLPAFRSKMHKFDYKVKFPFEYRREQFMNFQARFNDQIQIILERHQSSHLP